MKKLILNFLLVLSSLFVFSTDTQAQQEGFLGEVRLFAGNFAPRGWAFCDGQLLAISSNSALFSILGTTYGGDGRTTFGLPDLRGRTAVGARRGPGLENITLGERWGNQTTSLITSNLPPMGSITLNKGLYEMPLGGNVQPGQAFIHGNTSLVSVGNQSTETLTSTVQGAASSAFSNSPPSLGLNYIICIQGLFPSRN